MAPVVPRRRGHPADDDDSVTESDDSGVVNNSVRRSNGKRARLNDARSSEESPLLPDSYRSTARENGADDGDTSVGSAVHKPGAIVRVKLTNFVTYTAAEFHPGPSLNMVIGPNGTGKSTLVCAICLGLGSKTEVLGRAKDIADFVKHGAREAEIEIELKADPKRHESNPVVKHIIKRKDNKSSWFIDGSNVSRKAVLQLCRSFSIQIDNLCQFLPQDRVVEFAALSPVELLRETQRAAAPEHMTEWHEMLKKIRAEQRQSVELRTTNSEQLKNLEGRQNLQRGDVERLRERAEIQEQLAAMEKLRPFPRYNAASEAYRAAKSARKDSAYELANLSRELEPALRAVSNKQEYVNGIRRVVAQRERVVTNLEKKADEIMSKQRQLDDSIKTCDVEAEAEKETFKKSKQDRIRLDKTIKDIQRQIDTTDPGTFDFTAINRQAGEISDQIRHKEALNDEARASHDNNFNDIKSREQRITMVERNMENLRSKAGQQVNKLRALSRETATAWEWIQNNRDRFSGKVFGPPVIECSVKDPKMVKAFEASLGEADVTSLIVTNVDDFNMLQEELLGRLNMSQINLRQVAAPLSSWRPPMAHENLQTLGLHCYVLDLVEGPEEVLSMLCKDRGIHLAAVSLSDIDDKQFETLSRSSINHWVTPSTSYSITRRAEYGDAGTSTRTTMLREPRWFTNQAVDTREEERLRNEKLELQGELEELRNQREAFKEDHVRYSGQIKELKKQRFELQEEKSAKQRAQSEYKKLTPRLEQFKRKLEETMADAASYRVRVKEIKDRQERFILARAEEALKLMSTVSSLQKLQTDLFEAELLQIEAQSDSEFMQARNEDINRRLEQARQEVDRLKREEAGVKERAMAFWRQCEAVMRNELSPIEEALQRRLVDEKTKPDEFEAEIEATIARLEMVHEGNPHIIQEYENRAKEIDRIRSKLTRLDQELGEVDGKITEIRDKWEPELDALVGQISEAFGENFRRMGLAGEVNVRKEEDFENWAIQIEVKFRYVSCC